MNLPELSPEYFPLLEPPSGGLDRLRRRLAKPARRRVLRPSIVIASLGLVAILAGGLWTTYDAAQQERLAITELESVFTSAKLPTLSINGIEPVELDVNRDDLLVFLTDK